MSTRQTGNAFENAFIAQMEPLGYVGYPSRGSRGIDVLFIPSEDRSLPIVCAEVGGKSKIVRDALSKMLAHPRPAGSRVLVVRRIGQGTGKPVKWKYYTPLGTHATLLDAITAKAE